MSEMIFDLGGHLSEQTGLYGHQGERILFVVNYPSPKEGGASRFTPYVIYRWWADKKTRRPFGRLVEMPIK
jgi:hypothetical protein